VDGAVVSLSLVKLKIDLFKRPYLLQGRYTINKHELDTDKTSISILYYQKVTTPGLLGSQHNLVVGCLPLHCCIASTKLRCLVIEEGV